MLKVLLVVVFVLICIALTVIVLLQEGKSQGLGSISGMADSYWGKNKGRSMEGTLEKVTKFAAVAVLLLALILNIIW
ncbi:MAG: preprotein translocase subunit SecG [Hungatella sp.]|nr:preprotein translocase subunit SecG [Hungatella sp.]